MVTPHSPTITGYLYPWDLVGDPEASSWVAATGVDRLSLAAAYHSVRAATPRHPGRRIVDAGSAAIYLPLRQVWAGRRLFPAEASGWTGTDNSFALASKELRGTDIPVDAWTVLTHTSAAGRKNLNLCVRNAIGETYPYALCPSNGYVREYAATLLAEVLAQGKPAGLVLEAIGQLGVAHQNQHEKTDGAEYSQWMQALMSICFCPACLSAGEARGIPITAYRDDVRKLILHGGSPEATTQTSAQSQHLLPLLQIRWDATATLLDKCLEAVDETGMDLRISLHVSPDPWATGPFVPVPALRRSKIWQRMATISVIAPCWGDPDQGVETVGKLRRDLPTSRVGSYVSALTSEAPDAITLAKNWSRLLDAGAEELHIYHLGLASTRRLQMITEAIKELRGIQ